MIEQGGEPRASRVDDGLPRREFLKRSAIAGGAFGGAWALPALIREAYGDPVVYERHRHRYEVNPAHRRALEDAGMVVAGHSPDGRLVEIVEIPGHPFFVAGQFHPELRSRPTRPHPLFREFVGAALARRRGRVEQTVVVPG